MTEHLFRDTCLEALFPPDHAKLCELGDWRVLAESPWQFDKSGDLRSTVTFIRPGTRIPITVVSPVLNTRECWKTLGMLSTVSADVSLRLFNDNKAPFLLVEFGKGPDYMLSLDLRVRFFDTLLGEEILLDVQAAIIEEILNRIGMSWHDTAPTAMQSAVARQRFGVTPRDLVWERPDTASYGGNRWTVRVYNAGSLGMMVCHESDDMRPRHGAFGFIRRALFDDILDGHNPVEIMHELIEAAGIDGLETA